MADAAGAFLDSNILVYVYSADPAKADRADALLQAGGTVSVQVLNEFAHVMRRKVGAPWPDVQEGLAIFRSVLDVIPLSEAIHDAGIRVARRTGYSVWDSMIVAAAHSVGAETLWTEDMADGQRIEGLEIRNPFRT